MTPAALHAVLDTLPCGTWTATLDGQVEWMNAEARRFFGSSVAVGTAQPDWARVVHPGDWPRAESAWQSAVASGEPYDMRMRLLSSVTHRYHWHQCRAHRVVDAQGASRWVGLNVDIDAMLRGVEVQTASLERAQVERERLRSVFANCPVAITVYQGPDHRIALMNDANRRIIGGRDLEGRALAEAFPEIVSQGLVDILDGVLATGEPFEASEFEIQFDRYGDGAIDTGYFSFSLQALRDADGRIYGVLSSAVDVTEQVRARRGGGGGGGGGGRGRGGRVRSHASPPSGKRCSRNSTTA
jgi:PAS domain S-box-containing protein